MRLLLGTFLLRPYVFIFLVVYLSMAVPAWGWLRTLVYTILGYSIAWTAEYSSIHTGIPFGLYSYISAPTIQRELWVNGVPFMDSLSFVFLTFAGLQTARLMLDPLSHGPAGRFDIRWTEPGKPPSWQVWALGGILTMGLDLIIDPVALKGSEWFLGQIYHYPTSGFYFDVPLANFIGWAIVAWVITGLFLYLDAHFLRPISGPWRSYYGGALVGAALFTGVLTFNLGVTFAIGAVALGLAGCLLAMIMLAPIPARLLSQWKAMRSSFD